MTNQPTLDEQLAHALVERILIRGDQPTPRGGFVGPQPDLLTVPDIEPITPIEVIDPVAEANFAAICEGIDSFMENVRLITTPHPITELPNFDAVVNCTEATISVSVPLGFEVGDLQRASLRRQVTKAIFDEYLDASGCFSISVQSLFISAQDASACVSCKFFTPASPVTGSPQKVASSTLSVGDGWDFDVLHPLMGTCSSIDNIKETTDDPVSFVNCSLSESNLLHSHCTFYESSLNQYEAYEAVFSVNGETIELTVSTVRLGSGHLGVVCDNDWAFLAPYGDIIMTHIDTSESFEAHGTGNELIITTSSAPKAREEAYRKFFEQMCEIITQFSTDVVSLQSFALPRPQLKKGTFIDHASSY